jgi:DNA-binding NarL/FixJ family response regulator
MSTPPPSPKTPARVLIVDDHAIVRHGMAVLLQQAPEFTLCGEAGSYDDALTAITQQTPDVAVIDLILKERSGLDLIRELRQQGLRIPIVVMSMHDEATHAEKSVRAGAQGYVMKENADEQLVDALRTVLNGGLFISNEISSRMLQSYVGEEDNPSGVDSLTEREREIFACMGQGLTTRKIAERYGLSARTVEVHRARIKKKLGCEDAAQLLREAVTWLESQSI